MTQLIVISTITVIAIAVTLCIADYLYRLYVSRSFMTKLARHHRK